MNDNDSDERANAAAAETAAGRSGSPGTLPQQINLAHSRFLADHRDELNRLAEDVKRDADELGRHDKRLAKLAGRIDNANRLSTETKAIVDQAARDIADVSGHQNDHCTSLVEIVDKINEIAAAVNTDIAVTKNTFANVDNRLRFIEDAIDVGTDMAKVATTDAVLSRTRFDSVTDLAETVYARVRAADAWMSAAREDDHDPADIAAHHRQVAAVLAQMYATQLGHQIRTDQFGELMNRRPATASPGWASRNWKTSRTVSQGAMDAWRAHGRRGHTDSFEQCPASPCVTLDPFQRARAVIFDGEPTRDVVSEGPDDGDMLAEFRAKTAERMAAAARTDPASRPTESQLVAAFNAHLFHVGDYRFEQCPHAPCAGCASPWRGLHANSTEGLTVTLANHRRDRHGVTFAACGIGLCPSVEVVNRAEFEAATAVVDEAASGFTMKVRQGGEWLDLGYVAEDGLTTAAEPRAEQIKAWAKPDDGLADLKAAEAAQVATPVERAWQLDTGYEQAAGHMAHDGPFIDVRAARQSKGIDPRSTPRTPTAGGDIEHAWNTHAEHDTHDNLRGASFESCKLAPCSALLVSDRQTFADTRGEPNDPHREG